MAVYDNNELATQSLISIATCRCADFIDQSMADLRTYIVRSQTERALSHLSTRQLANIGIRRGEITEFSDRKARHWG